MTPQAVIRALFIALALVVLNLTALEIVARVWAVSAGVSDSHSVEFDIKYRLAQQKTKARHLILLMGNSRMRRSFFGELIENRLKDAGLSVEIRNIACSSCTPAMNRFLLETALQSGNRPDYIFFNTDPPNYFNTDLNLEGAQDAEQKFGASYLGRCIASPTQKERVSCFLKRHSYLLRFRDFYKRELQRLPQLVFKSDKKRGNQQRDTWRHYETDNGWAPLLAVWTPAEFSRYTAKLESERKKRYGKLRPITWSEAPMADFQAFIRSRNLRLVWVDIPKFGKPSQQTTRRLKEYARAHGQGFIDFSSALPATGQSVGQFYDAGHVNVFGAMALSERLATLLAAPPFRTTLHAEPSAGRVP